jgi:hypothetical protein
MLRPALTAGLIFLALAAPAAADGDPDGPGGPPPGYGRAPAGYGGVPAEYRRTRQPALARVRPRGHHGPYAGLRRGPAIQPVSYGETDGTVFHAWLPRNTNLPIYNIPPPFFPEP